MLLLWSSSQIEQEKTITSNPWENLSVCDKKLNKNPSVYYILDLQILVLSDFSLFIFYLFCNSCWQSDEQHNWTVSKECQDPSQPENNWRSTFAGKISYSFLAHHIRLHLDRRVLNLMRYLNEEFEMTTNRDEF